MYIAKLINHYKRILCRAIFFAAKPAKALRSMYAMYSIVLRPLGVGSSRVYWIIAQKYHKYAKNNIRTICNLWADWHFVGSVLRRFVLGLVKARASFGESHVRGHRFCWAFLICRLETGIIVFLLNFLANHKSSSQFIRGKLWGGFNEIVQLKCLGKHFMKTLFGAKWSFYNVKSLQTQANP